MEAILTWPIASDTMMISVVSRAPEFVLATFSVSEVIVTQQDEVLIGSGLRQYNSDLNTQSGL